MQFTVVLFFCVTSFVCVRGKQHGERVEVDIRKDQTSGCRKHRDHIYELAMNVTCSKPKEKLVTLTPKMGDVVIYPTQVYLKRCDCDHVCPSGGQCVPIMQEKKKHLISVIFGGRSMRKCLEVDLLEDVDCQCQCTKTKADCNEELQFFSQDSCSCMCKDENMYKKKCKAEGRNWNEESCICECSKKMKLCATGFTWSMDICMCVKVEMMDDADGIARPVTEDDVD